MKLLILSFLACSSLLNDQQDNSSDNEWLTKEWQQAYEQKIIETDTCCLVYIIGKQGEILATYDQKDIENKLLTREQYQLIATADFMFESQGHKFYLKN
ncbi:MAG: hypothetical protein OEY56_02905 [Cyclobacteriaceae bacterium]|nr:hypothetical protein [Cyclobacteriaceae bacterium]